MLQQIRIKYVTALRQATELRPEDLGAVRMVLNMALNELQDAHRQQLNDMDDIIADLLNERSQLRAAAATDAGEILRLQTMEDRLTQWVSRHVKLDADADIADVVIELLSKRGGATAAPPPIDNGNGHVKITDLGTRYTGRRLNINDDEVRRLAMAKIQRLAAELGRTPTQKDWMDNIQPDEPSLTSVKSRLRKNWNQLVADAGLEPNLNSHQRAAQMKQEAKAENAEAPFRGQ